MQVSNRCGKGLAADHMDGHKSDLGSAEAWPATCAASTVDNGGENRTQSSLYLSQQGINCSILRETEKKEKIGIWNRRSCLYIHIFL